MPGPIRRSAAGCGALHLRVPPPYHFRAKILNQLDLLVGCPSSKFLRQRAAQIKRGSGSLVDELRGLPLMLQATLCDGLAFDPFSLQQDCLAAPEVDVGRG